MTKRALSFGAVSIAIFIGCASSSQREFNADPTLPSASSSGVIGGGEPGLGMSSSGQLPTDNGACAKGSASLAQVPLYVLFLVDGSGSMGTDAAGHPSAKWPAFSKSFRKFVDSLEAQNNPTVGAGLFLFDGAKDLPGFSQDDVPVRYVDARQGALLRNRLASAVISGGTNTVFTLQGQLPLLRDFLPIGALKAGGRRVAVMISDGVPSGPSDVLPMTKARCVNMVQEARMWSPSVSFFSVGVGEPTADPSDYDPVFMGDLAVAGGESEAGCLPGWNAQSPVGSKPCHFQITPGAKTVDQLAQDFLDMMQRIQGTATCTLAIGAPQGGGTIDPSAVNVVMIDDKGKQTPVLQDPVDGWTYDDPQNPTLIKLHGSACVDAKRLVGGTVEVKLGCKTQVK